MREYTVGDCFYQIRNGANIKQGDTAGGYPITRIETTANDTFNRDRMGYAGITDLSKYESYVLEDGDLLMSHINSVQYLGRTVLYEKQEDETIIHGMNLLSLKANRDIIMPEFARFSFRSDPFKKQLSKITKKSVNQASFTVADLKKITLLVPSLSEQKEVVQNLDICRSIVEKRQRQLSTLDDLIKARFVEMFGDPETNPKGWKKKPLAEVITAANNGMARRGNNEDGNIVMRLVELQDGYIDYSNPNRIVLTDAEKKRYLLKDKDFLFARVNGNPDNVGRCAVFNDIGEPVYHNDHIIRVHFNDSAVDGAFASALLNSTYGKRQLKNQLKTSAGQYTVSQDGIGAVVAILPPIELQREFADFVKQVGKSKIAVQKALDEAQVLFDSLMQQYFG